MGVTYCMVLLLSAAPDILSSPFPDPEPNPAYGIIKTIKVFNEDSNSSSFLSKEIFTDFLEDEDLQVLSKESEENYPQQNQTDAYHPYNHHETATVDPRAQNLLNNLRLNGTYDPDTGLTCYKKVMQVQETRVS